MPACLRWEEGSNECFSLIPEEGTAARGSWDQLLPSPADLSGMGKSVNIHNAGLERVLRSTLQGHDSRPRQGLAPPPVYDNDAAVEVHGAAPQDGLHKAVVHLELVSAQALEEGHGHQRRLPAAAGLHSRGPILALLLTCAKQGVMLGLPIVQHYRMRKVSHCQSRRVA